MDIAWIWGLVGGGLIGLAGAVYLLGNGRIMGASGIIGGLVDTSGRDTAAERLAFLAALIAVPAALHYLGGARVDTGVTGDIWLIVPAGVLVGLGTRIGNGCTSGHGVCGISRLSPRGIVATLVYIGAGVLTVAAVRALLGAL
ncbi:YeeE/YedE family protein [Sulfitobacter sabulilitoris]|uniref:YeeE/YedE family protein n=1 Tax=Sulfitobacter sabulilitoris TaxID=2562655 RepID=A0A5S3PNK7_9RHOB|nr:YeeE/YedE thiosulfate transporter family protein [Sulfitobacter sabulilitoris]TMM54095.1 YeeE/YedE family protein [Sulfitobacter sabulilitoris]